MNWSTETWEAMTRKLGWPLGHGLAFVLFYASKPFPRWRERMKKWAWS